MFIRQFTKGALIFVLAAGVAVASVSAGAAERVRWKMASAFPGKLVQLGTLGKNLSEKVERVSGGNVQMKFFEPHALVPPLEMFDAVSAGAIDAARRSLPCSLAYGYTLRFPLGYRNFVHFQLLHPHPRQPARALA